MHEYYLYADFPAGFITERIVDALSVLPIRKFAALVEADIIKVSANEMDTVLQNLTHRNLRWNLIDEYAKACDVSLRYIIYGEEMPSQTFYSHYDAEAIALLNAVPPAKLVAAAEVVRSLYANPRSRISADNTPSAKIMAIVLLNGRLPKDVPEEELQRYTTDINAELSRLRQFRKKERMVFHINYILDMCTYYHLSPHWAFSLKGALLCNTPEADAFFDVFCLLSRTQQVAMLAMLAELCLAEDVGIEPQMWQRIQKVIAEEGGVVSCL